MRERCNMDLLTKCGEGLRFIEADLIAVGDRVID